MADWIFEVVWNMRVSFNLEYMSSGVARTWKVSVLATRSPSPAALVVMRRVHPQGRRRDLIEGSPIVDATLTTSSPPPLAVPPACLTPCGPECDQRPGIVLAAAPRRPRAAPAPVRWLAGPFHTYARAQCERGGAGRGRAVPRHTPPPPPRTPPTADCAAVDSTRRAL